MNTLGFIAAIVGALAWPVAAVILGVVFREPIGLLLRTAKKVKGLGVEFERDLDDLQVKAASLPALHRDTSAADLSWLSSTTKALREQAQAVAEIAPAAAISLAWSSVEQRLREVASKLLPNGDRIAKAFGIAQINALHKAGVIDNAVAAMLHQMRDLRNRVSHAGGASADLSIAEAKGYADVAAAIIEYLGSLLRHSLPPRPE